MIIPLTLFSLCVLVPNVVDGLRSVPDPVRQAATAMGFGTLRRLVRVELPMAIPVVIAGLRIAVVSSISLASVGQLIGVSSLGYFFIDGLQRDFNDRDLSSGIVAHHRARAASATCPARGRARLLTPWQPGRARRDGRAALRPAGRAGRRAGGVAGMSFLSFAWDWLTRPPSGTAPTASRSGSCSISATPACRC